MLSPQLALQTTRPPVGVFLPIGLRRLRETGILGWTAVYFLFRSYNEHENTYQSLSIFPFVKLRRNFQSQSLELHSQVMCSTVDRMYGSTF